MKCLKFYSCETQTAQNRYKIYNVVVFTFWLVLECRSESGPKYRSQIFRFEMVAKLYYGWNSKQTPTQAKWKQTQNQQTNQNKQTPNQHKQMKKNPNKNLNLKASFGLNMLGFLITFFLCFKQVMLYSKPATRIN